MQTLSKPYLPQVRLLSEGKESDVLRVTVIREKGKVLDIAFVASVASLVSIIYINFGCALDWGLVTQMLRRPVGPAIGFTAQFLFMPLVRLTACVNSRFRRPIFFGVVLFFGAGIKSICSKSWSVALLVKFTVVSTINIFLVQVTVRVPIWSVTFYFFRVCT